MRITSFTIFNQLTRSLQNRIREMSVHSERLSSGKKINKPSDDVYGMIKSMDYKVNINEIEQYIKNINEADSYLSLTDTVMSSVGNALVRARELAVQASSGTQTAQDRIAVSGEIANLRDELLRLANTKFRGKYIFSGFKTDTQPFDAGFNFTGDTNLINTFVDRGSTIAVNVTGDKAFSYGGETFFGTLDNLYNALITNDVSAIQSSLTSIDNAHGQVADVRADVGSRMSYMERAKTTHEDRSMTIKMLLSNVEDTDIAGSISEISKIEVALQSLRASGANAISQSLLDFLR